MTDLHPDNLPQGEVYIRITNNGPESLVNISVELGCSGTEFLLQGGTIAVSTLPQSISVSLDPGQTAAFDTTISIDTTQAIYELGCNIQVGFKDDNPANDNYAEWIPP